MKFEPKKETKKIIKFIQEEIDNRDERTWRTYFENIKKSYKPFKETLKEMYRKYGYQKTAKASDLEEYFIVKDTKLQDETKKWVNGFELLSKK